MQSSSGPTPSGALAFTFARPSMRSPWSVNYYSFRKLLSTELFRSDALRRFGFHVREAVYSEPLERVFAGAHASSSTAAPELVLMAKPSLEFLKVLRAHIDEFVHNVPQKSSDWWLYIVDY